MKRDSIQIFGQLSEGWDHFLRDQGHFIRHREHFMRDWEHFVGLFICDAQSARRGVVQIDKPANRRAQTFG